MKKSNKFGGCMTIPLALILLLAVFTLFSQWAAHTPASLAFYVVRMH